MSVDAMIKHHQAVTEVPSKMDNCFIKPRDGDERIFTVTNDLVIANLDGYAVIPIEDYHALYGAIDWPPVNSWPCASCAATSATIDGHDPCIANLPGVIHACCGHGSGHAYAMFADGRVIRGHFDHVRRLQNGCPRRPQDRDGGWTP